MKWYNVEIPYNTSEAIRRAEKFKAWLNDVSLQYEASSAGNLLHFEIFAEESHVKVINEALDCIVYHPVKISKSISNLASKEDELSKYAVKCWKFFITQNRRNLYFNYKDEVILNFTSYPDFIRITQSIIPCPTIPIYKLSESGEWIYKYE